jgi:RHS repeat-associated protein
MFSINTLEPITEGVYYTLERISQSTYEITRKNQTVLTFDKLSSDDDQTAYLTEIRDPNDNYITCNYENSKLSTVIDQYGRTLTFSYHSESGKEHLISKVLESGLSRDVEFDYDEDNNLIEYIDPMGNSTTYEYVESINGFDQSYVHLLKKIISPEGVEVENTFSTYNDDGSPASNGEGPIKKVVSQSNGSRSMNLSVNYITDTHIQASTVNLDYQYYYDGGIDGKITRLISPKGEFEYTYNDPLNPTKPTKIIDGNTNSTTITYDDMGNVLSIHKSGSSYHQFQNYNEFNKAEIYIDPRGKTTSYSYDNNGNLIDINPPYPISSYTITPNSDGTIDQISFPGGKTIDFSYNLYGNVKTKTNNMGHQTEYGYDNCSRMISIINPNDQSTGYSYWNNDLIKTQTNAENVTSTYNYNDDGSLTSVSTVGQTTALDYDTSTGLLESISNYSGTTSYDYYDDDLLQILTKPDNQNIIFNYDDRGNLTSFSGGSTSVSLGYDENNNLENYSGSYGAGSLTYDELDRITSYTDDFGNTVGFEYDDSGNLERITYPVNKVVTYAYYDNNQLESVEDWLGNVTTYHYYNDGAISYEYNYNAGLFCSYSYDPARRLVGYVDIGISNYSFTLDDLGNHVSQYNITELFEFSGFPQRNVSYTYDNANRILTAGNESFTHDSNGNITHRSGVNDINYSWDILDRLTGILSEDSYEFEYDIFGNRISMTKNGVTTRYINSIIGELNYVLVETDENNNPTNYYIYGLGLVSRIKSDNTTHFYHYDYRGNTIALTNSTGDITHKYSYDAFGNILQMEEDDYNPFRFVGRFGVMDDESGLNYMRARYYDPELGRFISTDPVWGKNLFIYVDNNPMIYLDPNGLHKTVFDFYDLSLGRTAQSTPIIENTNGVSTISPIIILSGIAIGIVGVYYGDPNMIEIGQDLVIAGVSNATDTPIIGLGNGTIVEFVDQTIEAIESIDFEVVIDKSFDYIDEFINTGWELTPQTTPMIIWDD